MTSLEAPFSIGEIKVKALEAKRIKLSYPVVKDGTTERYKSD